MTRKSFLKLTAGLMSLPFYNQLLAAPKRKMPALFIGHGSPMNIVLDNAFTKSLKEVVRTFEKPKAIIVISAHWYGAGTKVSVSEKQKPIYDFYGFPNELYQIKYEPVGEPTLAKKISSMNENIKMVERGLDHGAWSVLAHMYPQQDIPTFQLSLNKDLDYVQHFELGVLLSKLREHGVLVLASGSITHNLRLTRNTNSTVDAWAAEFDSFIKYSFSQKKFFNIINAKRHPLFNVSHPFDDHYLPLLYTAGMIKPEDAIKHFHEEIVEGNLSMRCIKVG